jgi:hypothetical protein
MRKIYALHLLLCLTSYAAFGQNWAAFTSGRTYHYKSDTATALPDQSIHFDDVTLVAADSIFSVARRFKPLTGVDTNQRNLPMFCGRDITARNDGFFNFKNPGNVALKTRANIGAFFAIDSLTGLTATVSRVYQGMVLGFALDSIKVFSTQTLDSLVLSKNYGILEWPASLGGDRFVLSGIQEDAIGQTLPGYDGFFPYHVGDEYFFESEISMGDLVEDRQVFRVRFKVDTNQRVIGGSNLHWQGFVRQESYLGGVFQNLNAAPASGSFMLLDRATDLVYKSHDEQVRAPSALSAYRLPSPWATYNITSAADSLNLAWDGMWTTMSYQRNAAKTELHLGKTTGAVGWLYRGIGGDTCVVSNDDQIRAVFKEGMGVTHVEFASFFIRGTFDLVGAIVDGDTTGVIFTDSLLMANAEVQKPILQWHAFPNPAQDQVTVQWTDSKAGELTLMDLAGKVIGQQPTHGLLTTLDVHHLPAGMYLLRFAQGGVLATKRIVVQH